MEVNFHDLETLPIFKSQAHLECPQLDGSLLHVRNYRSWPGTTLYPKVHDATILLPSCRVWCHLKGKLVVRCSLLPFYFQITGRELLSCAPFLSDGKSLSSCEIHATIIAVYVFLFKYPRDTIWKLRIDRFQSKVLCHWSRITIWNAGKQGRKFYRSLSDANKRKVRKSLIGTAWVRYFYNHNLSTHGSPQGGSILRRRFQEDCKGILYIRRDKGKGNWIFHVFRLISQKILSAFAKKIQCHQWELSDETLTIWWPKKNVWRMAHFFSRVSEAPNGVNQINESCQMRHWQSGDKKMCCLMHQTVSWPQQAHRLYCAFSHKHGVTGSSSVAWELKCKWFWRQWH